LLFFLGAASSAWPWLSGGGTICLMASVSCVNSLLLLHLVSVRVTVRVTVIGGLG
jgi:hypothetical protein